MIVYMGMKSLANILVCFFGLLTIVHGIELSNGRNLAACPARSISDSTKKFCCPETCGKCGGYGCNKRPGGASVCCTSKIKDSCSDSKPPCIIPTPGSGPYCSNGMEGYEGILEYFPCDVTVCCPKNCGTCDTSAKCNLADECCARKLVSGQKGLDTDISCRTNDPPCVVPYPLDDCTPNPCQNGARCGIQYGETWKYDACLQHRVCECEPLENYSGLDCELKCEEEETPCGYSKDSFGSSFYAINDRCCTAKEECLRDIQDQGYTDECIPLDRPRECSEKRNPCQNGGYCQIYQYYIPSQFNFYTSSGPIVDVLKCICLEGFSGYYCELEL